ncbi:MAG: choice-of-anchor V domain-containing protein [Archangium sp.]|nr:choice-of-anchor V domain-containing protein [Archangium sp.]MDP3570309.1 choice-of-anchor V domain-containing protein [Archangium sp.]
MSKHLVIACLGLLFPLHAWAYGGGIVGYSGKVASQTCTSCHGVGAGAAPTVTLTGPATLNPGQPGSYTLTLAGGPGVRGGMNVATSTAAAVLTAGPGSAKEGAELRHASPLAFSAGQVSWTFTVTAPTTGGSFTLYGAGNSCNGSGTGGDRSATATKVITVNVVNLPPSVTVAAGAAATSPTTQALSVGATDDGGEANLTYTWAATTAPAPVTFSANGTNAAKNTTATFTRAGSYTLAVTIRDAQNLTTTSTTTVNVAPQVMSVTVAPPSVGLATGRTQQFTASGVDQFGAAISPAPSWAWSATGGSINPASGLFTAGSTAGGPFTVTAASGGKTGTAQVTVSVGSPPTVATAATSSALTGTTLTLTALGADDGGEGNLTYTWLVEGGAAVAFSVNGTNEAKRTVATFAAAGSFTFTVVIRDLANLTATSSVPVVITAQLQAVVVSPATAVVPPGGTRQLSARVEDQFGNPLSPAPTVAWAVASAAGTISTSGLFRAAATPGGPYTVTATAGGQAGNAVLSVNTGGAPQVSMAPSASPSTVLGKSTALRVLGSDEGGEAGLVYTWVALGPSTVNFSENGSNAAKNTTAHFTRAGSYTLTVTLTDPSGMATDAVVDVTVAQTLMTITVSPSAINVSPSGTQIFAAVANDQFGAPADAVPQVSWTVSGGGSIDSQGLFTARDTEGGPFTVTAAAGPVRGTAITRVGEGPSDLEAPSVTLGELAATLSGTVKLTVMAQDNVGVTQVTWVLDGKPLGTVTTAPWDFVLRTRTLENGEHRLEAIAQDAALNSARSPQVAFVVANDVLQELEPVVGLGCSSIGSAPFALLALLCGLRLRARR